MSLTVALQTTSGATSAVVTAGQVLTLDVIATVTGADGTAANDGLQDVEGSFLSTSVGASSVAGNLAVTAATAPFNALGSELGTAHDLNGDGRIDVGSTDTSSTLVGDYFFARASGMQTGGVVSGATMAFTVATVTYTVTSLNGGGQTNIGFSPRDTSRQPGVVAAVWMDGSAGTSNETTGTFRAGSPFRVFASAGQAAATTGTVTATVYGDADGSGTRSGAETGTGAATVFVDVARTGAYTTGDPSGLTNSAGAATITGVPAGTYDVLEVPPTGYAQSQPTSGGYSVTVMAGATASAGPFGVEPDGVVTGTVYADVNDDGVQDAGDTAGPSGTTVFLDIDHSGGPDGGDLTAAIDGTGAFTFAAVPPGTYTLYPVVPSGYGVTQPTAGSYAVTVSTASTVAGAFGLASRGIVTGTVFDDANGDGVQDDGEAGLAGVTVYVDVNHDGLDGSDRMAVTDAAGTYTIGSVDGGTYTLSDVVPAGDTQTVPAGGSHSVTAVDGQTTDGGTFGIDVPATPAPTATTGAITGTATAGTTIYLDANGNGLLDAGEATTPTTADGTYAFTGLTPGTYTLRPLVPLGDVVTVPVADSDTVVVTAGATEPATAFTLSPLPASPLTALVASKPPATVIAGAAGTLKVRVTDASDAAFAGPVVLDVYASLAGTVHTQDVAIGTVTKSLKLKAAKSATVAVRYTFPSTLATGAYHLVAAASSGATTAPALATAAGTVAVSAATVDLSPTIVAAAAGVAVKPGKPGAVNVRITNGGTVTAVGTVTATLYATTTGTVDATAVMIGSVPDRKVKVAARKTTVVKVTFTAPALPAGSYRLIAVLSAATTPVDLSTVETSAAVATQ